jgi:hypothetical protein
MLLEKYKCTICNKRFIADNTHHHLDYCPCRKSWVDLEDYSIRATTTVEFIERFNPPWFEDEEEYHSALMSWLNDSDVEYGLRVVNTLFIYQV